MNTIHRSIDRRFDVAFFILRHGMNYSFINAFSLSLFSRRSKQKHKESDDVIKQYNTIQNNT